MIAVIIVLIFGAVFTSIAQIPLNTKEILWVWLGFIAHILGTFALVYITRDIYGYGDLLTYFREGGEMAAYVQQDLSRLPELFKLALAIKADLPFESAHRANSTDVMVALTAILRIILGNSLHASCLVFSFAAFSGNFAVYLVFRRVFPPEYRHRLALVSLLFPSVIFWTSGILKEAIALCGLGWLFYGAFRWVSKRYLVGSFFIIFGAILVGISKAYILFPFAVSFGAWIFWRKNMNENASVLSKPIYIIIGLLIAVGGVIILGNLFPRYAPDQLMESASTLQGYGAKTSSGSSYQLIDPNNKSISAQLVSAPLALISALFRPFLFEAHNMLSAINASETTALLVLFIFAMFKRGPREVIFMVRSSPTLIFCLIFVLSFGTGVGLASTNLGTLSRYRIPMMPFYGAIIMTLLPLWRESLKRS